MLGICQLLFRPRSFFAHCSIYLNPPTRCYTLYSFSNPPAPSSDGSRLGDGSIQVGSYGWQEALDDYDDDDWLAVPRARTHTHTHTHTVTHTHMHTHTHTHNTFTHTHTHTHTRILICLCVCVCARARMHACVCSCGCKNWCVRMLPR